MQNTKKRNNTQRLHHAYEISIIQKLQKEWKRAIDKAVKSHTFLNGGIHLPLINVTEMTKYLGLWMPERNEIRLSHGLVHQGRWDSILEVFLHETAHQIASQFPQYLSETSHGPLFHQCCRLIGANPKASGNYQSLEDRVWGEDLHSNGNGPSDHDKIMLKVKKLMSLASSTNQHEAEAAATKASELMALYNIDIIKNDKERSFESIIITEPTLKVSQFQSVAAAILTRFYFVEGIWIYGYIPEKDRWGKCLEISGTPTNLKIADYVFHYILHYAEISWKAYKKANPSCRSRSGYMTGVLSGFMEKLETQRRETAANQNLKQREALNTPMVIQDNRLVRYHETRHPNMVTRRRSHTTASRSAYNSGKSEGKKLTIAKGISRSDGNTGKRIAK